MMKEKEKHGEHAMVDPKFMADDGTGKSAKGKKGKHASDWADEQRGGAPTSQDKVRAGEHFGS